eukprot:CAMPEP_0184703320 /NCGR_PEP_ID=MMETSP0313-20130426/27301_1 /TAXON_ID=2792 /ORGANISM="Porphyridium aerugineum, Strain SAG 1380-2" /LENGTH=56 /DNA_ID=CAMNT_0027164051 /DNA_START=1 /DNA_END=167 /DNA_ORIENTATION=+
MARPHAWHRRKRGVLSSRGLLAANDPSFTDNTCRILILAHDKFTLAALHQHFEKPG